MDISAPWKRAVAFEALVDGAVFRTRIGSDVARFIKFCTSGGNWESGGAVSIGPFPSDHETPHAFEGGYVNGPCLDETGFIRLSPIDAGGEDIGFVKPGHVLVGSDDTYLVAELEGQKKLFVGLRGTASTQQPAGAWVFRGYTLMRKANREFEPTSVKFEPTAR